jgi:PAS domain S-box-containing protein
MTSFQHSPDANTSDSNPSFPDRERIRRRILTARRRWISILFFGLYVILAIFIFLFAIRSYTQFESEYRSEVERQLTVIAELKVSDLSDWRKERLEDGRIFKDNPVFADLIRRMETNPMDQVASADMQNWLSLFQQHYQYDQTILLDVQGNLLSASPAMTADNLAGYPLSDLYGIQQSNTVTLLDFHRDVENGPIFLSVLVPIRDSQNRPLGTVVLHINPSTNLYPFIQRWPVPNDTGESLLVRREGDDILFLNDLRFWSDAALNYRLPITETDLPAVQAVLGRTGVVDGVDYRGHAVIAAVYPIPESPWFLVAKLDTSEAFAPIHERLAITVALTLLSLGAIAGPIYYFWRRQMATFTRERRQSAAELQALASRQEAILAAVPDIIMQVDNDKRYTWANRPGYAFFGDDVIGHEASDYFLGEQNTYTAVQPLFAGERDLVYVESWQRRQDGEHRLLAWWCRVLRDSDDRVTGALSTARDITELRAAEQEFRNAHERLELATRAAEMGIWDWNIETNQLVWDDRMYVLYGVRREDFDGAYEAWLNGVHPDDRTASDAASEQARRGEREYDTEFRIIRPDGEIRWIRAHGRVIRNQEGKPVRMIGVNYDITARKQAEEAMRESEEKFRLIFENSPIGAAMVALDGRYLTVNPALCAILGYSSEELHRLTYHALTYPDDMELTLSLRQKVLDGRGSQVRFTKRYIHKDGHVIWVEVGSALVMDISDKPAYFVTNILDITEQRRIEEELRESEDKFRYVFDYSAVGKSITLPSGQIYVNQAFCDMLGYTSDELQGQTWQEITHPDDIPMNQNLVDDMVQGRRDTLRYRKRYLHKNGSVVWVDVSSAIRRNPEGLALYLMTTATNITEQVHAEEEIRRLNEQLEQRVRDRTLQLEAANRELEAFSYSVSHDLRAPLRGISGWATALEEDYGDTLNEEARGYLERILVESRLMSDLIDDLLQLSRVTRTDLEKTNVDLSAMVYSISERLRETHPKRRVEVRIQPDLHASCDIHLMQIVLTNLMDNAWKFSQPTKKAHVEFGRAGPDRQSAFYVRDNGVGFDMVYADKLFGAFQRLHKASEFPGTGVGLATVQRIIHRHGGRIWAEAEPDRGATFYFTLGENP